MSKPADIELRSYALAEMLTAEHLLELARELDLPRPRGDKVGMAKALARSVSLDGIEVFCRKRWLAPPVATHLANLRSGKLAGHGWHGAAPSRLHLSLQDKVRAVARGELDLDALIAIGADIAKHEYYMVAVADLCEHAIVTRCGGIPPLRSRAVSDVILAGVPYDLKNGSVPGGWTFGAIRADRKSFARSMITGADTERLRKQAKTAYNGWANNRLFVVAPSEDAWIYDAEGLLESLVEAIKANATPMTLRVQGVNVQVLVITIQS